MRDTAKAAPHLHAHVVTISNEEVAASGRETDFLWAVKLPRPLAKATKLRNHCTVREAVHADGVRARMRDGHGCAIGADRKASASCVPHEQRADVRPFNAGTHLCDKILMLAVQVHM